MSILNENSYVSWYVAQNPNTPKDLYCPHIEENNKPTYTAELDYNALKEGRFNFKQLVDLNNRFSDLDSEKKAVVERLLIHHQAERFYLLKPLLKLAH